MAIGISPLVDFAFKMVFGNEHHPRLTIHFLNSMLTDQPRIVSVRILNPIQNRKTARGKLSILDVLATDEIGRILNVEVQTWLPQSMEQRIVYYTARSYVDQLQKGQNYSALRPSISICILAEPLFSDPAELHLDFRLREKRSHRTLTDDLQIHVLQLSYLQVTAETVYNASDEERWLMFLRDADKLTKEQIIQLFPDKEFAEAAGVLEMIAKTPEERMEYEARLKYRRDQAGRRQQALMEGHQQGLAEGRLEGLAKGWQAGQITLMQELLGLPTSTPDELAACEASQLNQLVADLQQQLKARGF